MKRVLYFTAAMLLLAGLAQAQIQRNVSLIDVRNPAPVDANDFHLILGGISIADLYPDGYYDADYAKRTVWTDTEGKVHIYWEEGSTPSGQRDKFGYALRGGVQYTSCEWYWTKDGAPIGDPLPDVLQDWIKIGNELRDVVRYRAPITAMPVYVQRTAGYQLMVPDSFFDIFIELSMPQPPAPVVVDPVRISVAPQATLVYPWTVPDYDPAYFMFYDVFSNGGDNDPLIRFHNMAVVPEPAMLSLLGLGSLLALRRKR